MSHVYIEPGLGEELKVTRGPIFRTFKSGRQRKKRSLKMTINN